MLSHGPTGYILSYGLGYKNVLYEGEALQELPACPPSATAVHAAFVSKCGFSPVFTPTLDEDATELRIIDDVRRVTTTMTSRNVVVLFFSGHGTRTGDSACVVDGAGCLVSVRKLQTLFTEMVADRGLRDVAFVAILDCCQTPPSKLWTPAR